MEDMLDGFTLFCMFILWLKTFLDLSGDSMLFIKESELVKCSMLLDPPLLDSNLCVQTSFTLISTCLYLRMIDESDNRQVVIVQKYSNTLLRDHPECLTTSQNTTCSDYFHSPETNIIESLMVYGSPCEITYFCWHDYFPFLLNDNFEHLNFWIKNYNHINNKYIIFFHLYFNLWKS